MSGFIIEKEVTKRDTPPCVTKRDGGVAERDTINKFAYMKTNIYLCIVQRLNGGDETTDT